MRLNLALAVVFTCLFGCSLVDVGENGDQDYPRTDAEISALLVTVKTSLRQGSSEGTCFFFETIGNGSRDVSELLMFEREDILSVNEGYFEIDGDSLLRLPQVLQDVIRDLNGRPFVTIMFNRGSHSILVVVEDKQCLAVLLGTITQ